MPFFARPNLDDIQFKQLTGTTLTLSGTTIFNSVCGGYLNFTDEVGAPIPVIISSTGRTDENVLKYVCGCITLGVVSTGGTSTGFYPYNECSTCAVGGLPVGSCLYQETIADILHDILVPTLYPTLISPYSVLTISPSESQLEIGSVVNVTGSTIFNQGSISPAYCGGPSVRSGAAIAYSFSQWGAPYETGVSSTCIFAPHIIGIGNNIAYSCVHYAAGLQPLDSEGLPYLSACTAGSTNSSCPSAVISRNIVGIYPWFYGSSISVPVVGDSLIAAATCKCVQSSTGDIVAEDYNVTGEYIWFAIPTGSTSMLKWQGSNSTSNCGTIPGDLFASEVICGVNSPDGCWLGSTVSYRFYVSNYPTSINYCMTFKRS